MIKIVKGSYGLRVGTTIKPINAGDAPIEIEKDQEARLVKLGVAVYVGAEQESTPVTKGQKGKKGSVKESPEQDEELPELSAEDPVDNE